MDLDLGGHGSTRSYACLCGRTFSGSGAFTYHKRSCKQSKKRLNGALENAKELWSAKKRRRIEATELRHISSSYSDTTGEVVHTTSASSEVDDRDATTEVCSPCSRCICC